MSGGSGLRLRAGGLRSSGGGLRRLGPLLHQARYEVLPASAGAAAAGTKQSTRVFQAAVLCTLPVRGFAAKQSP